MLWGVGLEGSLWLELGTAVLRPADDSAGDLRPFLPCLNLGPFVVIPEASMSHDLPGCDCHCSGCSAWPLGAQPSDRLCKRSHSPPILSRGTGLFEVPTLPVLWCMTRLSAAPGTLPLCLSRVA